MLVLYHSRTGACARAAALLAGELEALGMEVTAERLEPAVDLPYPVWLLLSFIPRMGWPVKKPVSDPGSFDGLALIFPKWTFADPVIESFIRRFAGRFPPTALVVTCGGWDHERYTSSYTARLHRLGVELSGADYVKKKLMEDPDTLRKLKTLAASLARSAKS